MEFQIPVLPSFSDNKSTLYLSGFFATFSLSTVDRKELINTLISVEFSGVSLPS